MAEGVMVCPCCGGDGEAACVFRFRSVECGYDGPAAGCDSRKNTCREMGNLERFGAFHFNVCFACDGTGYLPVPGSSDPRD